MTPPSILFYNIALLLLFPVYRIGAYFSRKLQFFRNTRKESMIRLQKEYPESLTRSRPVWLHASSVGEMDQALGLLREIRRRQPDTRFVVSVFSTSVKSLSHPEIDFMFYLPLDFFTVWPDVITRIRPRYFVTMTWDVFPNLLHHLHVRQIPSFLCSAALSKNSSRARMPAVMFHRPVYDLFSGIGVVDEENQGIFEKILPEHKGKIRSTGDSRFDTILYKIKKTALDKEVEKKLDQILGKKTRAVILGSTYNTCDEEIYPHLRRLMDDNPGWKFLIFPHHTDEKRLKQTELHADENGFPLLRFSDPDFKKKVKSFQAILVDVMGILALAYSRSSLCYIGGAFHNRVHNTGEPAALGNPILTGPRIDTSPVALDLEKAEILHRCENGVILAENMQLLMNNEELRKAMAVHAKEYIHERSGASARFYDTFLHDLI